MRKLVFTLSCVNAFLNALLIAVFMPPEVIVWYDFAGHASHHGSRWFYLILVAVPVLIAGGFLLQRCLADSKKKNSSLNDSEEGISPIDEMLSDNSLHSDNWGMVLTWFFAIIGWVFTGIALNDIEDISIIMPSIVVIMLSAVVIFFSSFYGEVVPNAVSGIILPWLSKDAKVREKTGRCSFYLGVMGGFAGVCLAAWSLVVSSIIPDCVAVGVLLLTAFIIPMIYSYFIYKKSQKK